MTDVDAAKIVAMLVTAFPSQMAKLSNEQQADTRTLYRRMLLDLDAKAAEAAVVRLISTSRFWPSVAEIRDAAQTTTVGHKRTGAEGWGDVKRTIGREGVYRRPRIDFSFADQVVDAVVHSLGWVELCNSENEIADRARFIQAYDAMASTARQDAAVPGAHVNRIALPAPTEAAPLLPHGNETPMTRAEQMEFINRAVGAVTSKAGGQ